ncbi:MAG: hypothetical protein RQ826_04045 [Xanthomonadales bacterium]|nr:hypothetical protein [Xanthomonadales bacterium]
MALAVTGLVLVSTPAFAQQSDGAMEEIIVHAPMQVERHEVARASSPTLEEIKRGHPLLFNGKVAGILVRAVKNSRLSSHAFKLCFSRTKSPMMSNCWTA